MKGKIHQIILVNIILVGGFMWYLYYLVSLPSCEGYKLLIKLIPLIIIILITVIYDIIMQKKINLDIENEINKEVKNVSSNLQINKNK